MQHPSIPYPASLACVALSYCVAVLSPAHAQEAAPPQQQPPPPELHALEAYALDNGLRVLLKPDAREPLVAVAVAYDVGSRDDPPGYRGLAHLVEHMTFRGSRHAPDGLGGRLLDAAGARWNGFTAPDHTVYAVELPAHKLPLALWLESERMGFALDAWTEDALDIELDVVRSEWLERGAESVGAGLLELQYHAMFPPGHPYRGIADRGEKSDFDFELEHVRWHHQTHYRPDRAVLALVGSFDAALAKQLIAQYFAPLRGHDTPPPRTAVTPVSFRSTRLLDLRWRYPRPEVVMRWHVQCADHVCPLLLEMVTRYVDQQLPALAREHALELEVSTALIERASHYEIALSASLPVQSDVVAGHVALGRALAALRASSIDEETRQALVDGMITDALEELDQPWSQAIALVTADDPATLDLEARARMLRSIGAADLARAVGTYLSGPCLVARIESRDDAEQAGELHESTGALGFVGEELQ